MPVWVWVSRLPLVCAGESVLTTSPGYHGDAVLSKSLAGPAFFFRRCRGQPAVLVRARGPAPFLSAAVAIFQVGGCAWLSRLSLLTSCTRGSARGGCVLGSWGDCLEAIGLGGGWRGLLSGEAGPGSVLVSGRPPNPRHEHVVSGWDLKVAVGLNEIWVCASLDFALARRVPAESARAVMWRRLSRDTWNSPHFARLALRA